MPTLGPEQSIVGIGWHEEAEFFAQAAVTVGVILAERTVDCEMSVSFNNGAIDMGQAPSLRDTKIQVFGIGDQSRHGFTLRSLRDYCAIDARLTEESYALDEGQEVLETSLVQGGAGVRQIVEKISSDGDSKKISDKPAMLFDAIPEWLQKVRENSGWLPESKRDPRLELVGKGVGLIMVKQESLVPVIASLTRTFGGVLGKGSTSEISTAGRLNFDISSSGRIYSGDQQGVSLRVEDSAMKQRADFSLGFRCGVVGPSHAFVESSLRQADWSSGQLMVTKETLRRGTEGLEVTLESKRGHEEVKSDGTRPVENDILLEMANKTVALMTREDAWEH